MNLKHDATPALLTPADDPLVDAGDRFDAEFDALQEDADLELIRSQVQASNYRRARSW